MLMYVETERQCRHFTVVLVGERVGCGRAAWVPIMGSFAARLGPDGGVLTGSGHATEKKRTDPNEGR